MEASKFHVHLKKIHCRCPKPSPMHDPSSHRPDESFGASGLPRTEKRESTLIFNFVSTVASGPRGVSPIILCFDGDLSATVMVLLHRRCQGNTVRLPAAILSLEHYLFDRIMLINFVSTIFSNNSQNHALDHPPDDGHIHDV